MATNFPSGENLSSARCAVRLDFSSKCDAGTPVSAVLAHALLHTSLHHPPLSVAQSGDGHSPWTFPLGHFLPPILDTADFPPPPRRTASVFAHYAARIHCTKLV